MRYIVIIVFLGLIVSCKKENTSHDNEVVLTLLNDSLNFSGSDGHYKHEGDLEKGTNVVRYKITNNSDDKLLFFVVNAQQLYNSSLTFDIADNEGKPVKKGYGISCLSRDTCSFCEFDIQKRKSDTYSKIVNGRLKDEDLLIYMAYERDKVIIAPGESWEFHALASFPVEYFNGSSIWYDLKEDFNYTLALTYEVDDNLFKELPDFEKENLKRNNIKIFDGKLVSNRVKLVHVD